MGKPGSAFTELVFDAALNSFWRKSALRRFLIQQGVPKDRVPLSADRTKRDILDDVFGYLAENQPGRRLILLMARDLANRTDFPDLMGWEDTGEKLERARGAVAVLRKAVGELGEEDRLERERNESAMRVEKRVVETRRAQHNLQVLSDRLSGLARELGEARAGYDFQKWFYDLTDHFDIVSRRPYVSNGRQIDGSVTLSGTTYIVELKFTTAQVGATDIDSVRAKVATKADNTMAIFVAMAGYTSVAIREASGPRTPLLLLDHSHVLYCLDGLGSLTDLIERLRRHASQTGEAYLAVSELDG